VVNSLNSGRSGFPGGGVQTAGIVFGGYNTASTGLTESYNGTSWTNLPSMSTARNVGSGTGSQTAALSSGGSPNTSSNRRMDW
jgi:hypothetical protein